MDSFLVSGKVSFVSRSDGVKLSEVELEGGRGWLCFSPDEFLPKRGDWITAKGYLREGTDGRKRRLVQYWRGLTQPEVETELEAQRESVEVQKEALLGVEGERFRKCWVEALKIVGVAKADKFRVCELDAEDNLGLVVFNIAKLLYEKVK